MSESWVRIPLLTNGAAKEEGTKDVLFQIQF